MKIDLEKAYDYVLWEFMVELLKEIKFLKQFIKWTKTCITTTSFRTRLNGCIGETIEGSRGLRQRDPLSPLLFVIVMEYFATVVKKYITSKEFKYHPNCNKLKRAQLTFADNLILFCKANRQSIEVMMGAF